MALLAALALGLAAAAPAVEPPLRTVTLAGRTVEVREPAPPLLRVETASGVAEIWRALEPKIAAAPYVWRTKVILVPRTEIVERGADEIVRLRRASMDRASQTRALEEIAWFQTLAEMRGEGAFRMQVDVETEPEIVRDTVAEGETAFGREWTESFVKARLNRGRFDADDGVFRGPFDSAFVIVGALETLRNPNEPANGAMIWGREGSLPGAAANGMMARFAGDVSRRALSGHPPLASPFEGLVVPGNTPDALASQRRAVWTSLLATPPTGWPTSSPDAREPGRVLLGPSFPDAPWQDSPALGPGFNASSVSRGGLTVKAPRPDAPPGSFVVEETGMYRSGQIRYPWRIASGRSVRFRVRSQARDPLLISVRHATSPWRQLASAIVGRVDPVRFAAADQPTHALGDAGEWITVALPLPNPMPEGGVYLSFEPPPAAFRAERDQLGPLVWELADLAISPEEAPAPAPLPLPAPDPNGESPGARLLAVPTATLEQLRTLALDRNDTIKLNATLRLATLKDPGDVGLLTRLAQDVVAAVAEAALGGLAAIDTPESWAAVRQILDTGPFEPNRAVAATLLARAQQPNVAGPISRLIASPSWQTRRAAVRALTELKDPQAAVLAVVFLQETNPSVRLEVVDGAKMGDELVRRRLRFAAVNDASDAVRLAALLRLVKEGDEEDRREALRGARDESRWVRLQFVRSLGNEPWVRPALRIAIGDADREVRFFAIRAFAQLEGPVTLEEIAPALKDADPDIRRELESLAQAKGLALPPPPEEKPHGVRKRA